MKISTRKLAIIALLTAMYCVLSFCMKFIIVGNTMIDLGYIALTVACFAVGGWGAFVGAVGCGLESLLFSTYGFSVGWFVANLIIGLGCGLVFKRTKNIIIQAITIVICCAVGLFGAKGLIECYLYGIPLAVKMARIVPQFIADTVTMIVGLGFVKLIPKSMIKY